jgi:hypothetical protein
MRRLAILLLMIPALAAPVMAPAAPGEQAQRIAAQKLRDYGLETDTSLLTTSQIAAIILAQNDPDNGSFGGDFRIREELKAILRKNPATNPDLK